MERLWAPWRMQYIGGEQRTGCLFCRVIENPSDPDAELVVWRPDNAIVMLNKFPYNPGHLMVAPRAHKASLEDLDDSEGAELMSAVRTTLKVVRATLNPDGFNVGANIGRPAGATEPGAWYESTSCTAHSITRSGWVLIIRSALTSRRPPM